MKQLLEAACSTCCCQTLASLARADRIRGLLFRNDGKAQLFAKVYSKWYAVSSPCSGAAHATRARSGPSAELTSCCIIVSHSPLPLRLDSESTLVLQLDIHLIR